MERFKTLTHENGKFTRTTHYVLDGFSRNLSAEELQIIKTDKDLFADEVDNYPMSTDKLEYLVVTTGKSSYIIAQFVAGDDKFMDISEELIEHIVPK
jgi:hypothetical protein